MGSIHYQIGDATVPQAKGVKIICHICNDVGGWGKGFVLALSAKWKEPEAAYYKWYNERRQNDFALGAVQLVRVEPDVWVANLVGQYGLTRRDGLAPIRYGAVEQGLRRLAKEAQKLNASVHMPRIGCGLAGGTWEKIEPIIERALCENGTEVFVYDLPPHNVVGQTNNRSTR